MPEKGNRTVLMFEVGQLHRMKRRPLLLSDEGEIILESYAETLGDIGSEIGLSAKQVHDTIRWGDAIDLGYISATISDMKRRIVQKAVMGKMDIKPLHQEPPKGDSDDTI